MREKIALTMGLALFSCVAFGAETYNLIDRIIEKPDSHTVGEWIIGTDKIKVNEQTKLLGDVEPEKNACVKVTVIRDEEGALWAQQVTILPIKNEEVCKAEAAKTVKDSGLKP